MGLTTFYYNDKMLVIMTVLKEPSTKTYSEAFQLPLKPISSVRLYGALWKLVSCAAFACMNGLVRYLSGGSEIGPEIALPTNVIMFFQNFIGAAILVPLLFKVKTQKNNFPNVTSVKFSFSRHPFLHAMRVVSCVLGVSLFYLSLKYLPIAEAVALTFIGPVFSVLGAKLWLKENFGMSRLAAIFLSLIGAYIIARPDTALFGGKLNFGWAILLPLCSALAFAFDKLLTRKLTQKGETAETLAMYLLFLMTPVSAIPALFNWVTPNINHLPWIFLLGGLAVLAQISFAKAYQYAEVSFLTPLSFSKFLFSTLVGIFIFSEFPKSAVWVGISIIACSIILLSKGNMKGYEKIKVKT